MKINEVLLTRMLAVQRSIEEHIVRLTTKPTLISTPSRRSNDS